VILPRGISCDYPARAVSVYDAYSVYMIYISIIYGNSGATADPAAVLAAEGVATTASFSQISLR
jgi:hypothetical protein